MFQLKLFKHFLQFVLRFCCFGFEHVEARRKGEYQYSQDNSYWTILQTSTSAHKVGSPLCTGVHGECTCNMSEALTEVSLII